MTTAPGARTATLADNTATVFAATFRANEASGVTVVLINTTTFAVTPQVQGLHYSVVLNADTGQPTVTFFTPPAGGQTVAIFPTPTYTQQVAPAPGGPLFGSTVEEGYDRLLALIQGLQDQLNQALRAPQADGAVAALANANARRGTFLTFNATTGAPQLRDLSEVGLV